MFLEILRDICLPILMVMGLGWLLDRRFDLSLDTMVKLNLYVLVPAFIFVKLSTSELEDEIGGKIILFTVCVMGGMALLSWIVSRSREERITMQLGTMFYNSGNWGIPLIALAFPGLGPVVQVFVLTTMNVSMFTVGIFLAGSQADSDGGGNSSRLRRIMPVARQPSIYAVVLALVFRHFGNPVEDWIFLWKPLNYLADGLVAFALITLGVQLSKTRPPRVGGRLAWALGIRLLGGPLVAVGLTLLFGFRGEMAAILIAGAASPTAVNVALVTHEFKGDSRFAAATVFYSTLLAVLIVTVLLGVLRLGAVPWAG